MENLRKSSVACLVMVLMIIVGTLAGSHNSLMGMRKDAEAVFSLGVRGDGVGILGDLRERQSLAYNMVVIARKYLPEDHTLIRNVLDAGAGGGGGASLSVPELASADRALELALKDLFDVLNAMELAEVDARYPQRLYTDFRARGDTISHDPYNQVASAFNKTLAGFPAGVLGGLTGVRPLALYE